MQAGDAANYAEWFKVLAVPTRIQILHELAMSGGAMDRSELASKLGIGSSTASMHLGLLERTELVVRERAGGRSRFRLNARAVEAFPTPQDVAAGRQVRPVVDVDAPFTWIKTVRRRQQDPRA